MIKCNVENQIYYNHRENIAGRIDFSQLDSWVVLDEFLNENKHKKSAFFLLKFVNLQYDSQFKIQRPFLEDDITNSIRVFKIKIFENKEFKTTHRAVNKFI